MSFTVEGTVTSGHGKGKEFVSLEQYTVQFDELLGYKPYPGTLNLELSDSVNEKPDQHTAIRIEGWEDSGHSFGAVNAYPASVIKTRESIPLHLIVPDRTDHDTSTLEFISPVNLRKRFALSDGSSLEICVESRRRPSD